MNQPYKRYFPSTSSEFYPEETEYITTQMMMIGSYGLHNKPVNPGRISDRLYNKIENIDRILRRIDLLDIEF